ncbi:hypothetical protein BDR04DRAFT_1099829 [Suillus decipiens]|nr:hypothetical protein BDR04DRAFT_1099829 [Suillus decipiens]
MDISTEAHPCCISKESHLPVAIATLQDASATSRPSSDHVCNAEVTPSLGFKQLNSNNYVIIIQNNRVAEGGTINIYSSHCNGSTVTKLENVVPTSGPMPEEPSSVVQPEPGPVGHGCDTITLNGNTFGDYTMINIKSPNCTGAVEQTALVSNQ